MKNLCLILFLLQISYGAQAFVTDVVTNNNQGIELLKKQNFSKAQDYFSKAMSESPYSTELQLNLGLTFDGAGQPEKAMQSYEQAEKLTKDPALLFASYFNRAEILGKQKKVPEALAFYQKALDLKPDSVEAKTNIEILTQQQQGGGKGQDNQDQKDQNKDKKDDKDNKDQKDQDKDKDQDQDKKDQKKDYAKNKPQPKPFQSPDISKDDAKKILDELDRQEQRVRAEYNKKQHKERPHGKDW